MYKIIGIGYNRNDVDIFLKHYKAFSIRAKITISYVEFDDWNIKLNDFIDIIGIKKEFMKFGKNV